MWFEKFGLHKYSSGLKMDIAKQEISDWSGSYRKMTSHCKFKTKTFEKVSGYSQKFLEKWKMVIVKQVRSDWPGNNGKMTSHSTFKLRVSENPLE